MENLENKVQDATATSTITLDFGKEELLDAEGIKNLKWFGIRPLERRLKNENLGDSERASIQGQIDFMKRLIKASETGKPIDETEQSAAWAPEEKKVEDADVTDDAADEQSVQTETSAEVLQQPAGEQEVSDPTHPHPDMAAEIVSQLAVDVCPDATEVSVS